MNHQMLGTPPKEGGMGQMYLAYSRKLLHAMRVHPELFRYPLGAPVLRIQAPVLTYVALL